MDMRHGVSSCAVLCMLLVFSHTAAAAPEPFVATVAPAACGQAKQACCAGATCNAGLFCDKNSGNTCQYNCGGIGQYCCSNSASGGCNGSGLFCQKGLGSEAGSNFCIENCGRSGQRCCRNNWCAGNFYCDSKLKCQKCTKTKCGSNGRNPCGNPGEKCCSKNSCVAGTFCDTTSTPPNNICRPYCGAAGQRCCPVKSKGYDGCNKNQGIYCDDNVNTGGTGGTGLCTYNCGFENQQCCPRGFCSSGLNCVNAKCIKQSTCGGADQTCCAGANPCVTGYFCFKGMCRQNCGIAGQGCCVHDKDWCKSGRCRPSDKMCE